MAIIKFSMVKNILQISSVISYCILCNISSKLLLGVLNLQCSTLVQLIISIIDIWNPKIFSLFTRFLVIKFFFVLGLFLWRTYFTLCLFIFFINSFIYLILTFLINNNSNERSLIECCYWFFDSDANFTCFIQFFIDVSSEIVTLLFELFLSLGIWVVAIDHNISVAGIELHILWVINLHNTTC